MESGCTPDEISCGDQIFDLCFHPTMPVIGVGLIDGTIEIHKYSLGESSQNDRLRLPIHKKSCRGVLFNEDGTILYSISSDKSIKLINQNGQVSYSYRKCHDEAINKIHIIDPNSIATGDDSGCVRIWDIRQPNYVKTYELHEDFVSGLSYSADKNTLISIGGDATLSAYDLRIDKNTNQSDDQEAELHCLQLIKGETKVVCGTQEGVLLIFSWGKWGDCSDRFPGHPQPVNALLKIDEDTVITGSDDGLIRVVTMFPHRIQGVLGDHEDFPVEGFDKSRDQRYGNQPLCMLFFLYVLYNISFIFHRLLASFAHDEIIRFWDLSFLADSNYNKLDRQDEKEEEAHDNKENEEMDLCVGDNNNNVENRIDDDSDVMSASDLADDVDDNDSDNEKGGTSDSDEDEDDDFSSNNRKKGKKIKLKTAAEKFYSDL